MAQFDLYRIGGALVVDLQTDLIPIEDTRIVAPLLDGERYASFPRLTPLVDVDGVTYVVRIQQLAAVRAKQLGAPIGSIRTHADDLLRALDILTRGF